MLEEIISCFSKSNVLNTLPLEPENIDKIQDIYHTIVGVSDFCCGTLGIIDIITIIIIILYLKRRKR